MKEDPGASRVTTPASDYVLDCRGRLIDCTPPHPAGAVIMGILNVTPDSFSDGGRYTGVTEAVRRAAEMLEEGATIIDVGGESSRPRGKAYGSGAAAVSVEEEIARVEPVVRAIARELPEAIISVDTYKSAVARAVLDAGAHIINDVTALRYFPETAALAAEAGSAMILMHSIGRPGEMPQEHRYTNVVREVRDALHKAENLAAEAGVQSIALDPGFGFGKSVDENYALLSQLDRIAALGRPVLIGVSRKNSIGVAASKGPEPLPVDERLFGSLGATAVGVMRGATLVRTHDVKATVEMLRVLAKAAAESR